MHRTPSTELLAWAIERDGIGHHETQVAAVLNRVAPRRGLPVGTGAGRTGMVDTATLVAVVADRSQPAVARERAFGRLLAAVARPQPAVLAALAASRQIRPAA